jgi:hypothetical protein
MEKNLIFVFFGLVVFASNAFSDVSVQIIQPKYPLILVQPEDQYVPIESSATFSVTTENANGYQWLKNGDPMDNQTNDTLVISNAGISDVSYYSCDVFKDAAFAPTRSASLLVYTNSIDPQTGVDPVVIYTLPLSGSGGQGTCPGHYIGYANYSPGTNAWGWVPDTTNGNTVFFATDTNRSNTKIQYLGEYGDSGCNQMTVTIPNPPTSPQYVFTIFFTNNVPTNAYPITLDGFYP